MLVPRDTGIGVVYARESFDQYAGGNSTGHEKPITPQVGDVCTKADNMGRPGSGTSPRPRPADHHRMGKRMTSTTYEAHCRKPGCTCQHLDCHRGWRDTEITAPKQETTPCERCRPDTHRRWLDREAARMKDYPGEALERIMRGTSK